MTLFHWNDLYPIVLGITFSGMSLLFKDSSEISILIRKYAKDRNTFRVLFFGGILLCMSLFIILGMANMIMLYLPNYSENEIISNGINSKSLPPGTYSVWALVVLASGTLLLFGRFSWALIRDGVRGMKMRKTTESTHTMNN